MCVYFQTNLMINHFRSPKYTGDKDLIVCPTLIPIIDMLIGFSTLKVSSYYWKVLVFCLDFTYCFYFILFVYAIEWHQMNPSINPVDQKRWWFYGQINHIFDTWFISPTTSVNPTNLFIVCSKQWIFQQPNQISFVSIESRCSKDPYVKWRHDTWHD